MNAQSCLGIIYFYQSALIIARSIFLCSSTAYAVQVSDGRMHPKRISASGLAIRIAGQIKADDNKLISQYIKNQNPSDGPIGCWRSTIAPIRIYPGSPWENGYNERFNGTLRDELLDAEWFATTRHAQTAINAWMREYNHVRPHQALGMRPPAPTTD